MNPIRIMVVEDIAVVDRSLKENSPLVDSLRESESRLKLVLTASKMGVWEWDLRTNEVSWSPECFEIIGMERPNGTIQDFRRAVHPEDIDQIFAAAREAMIEKEAYAEEYRIMRPGGEERWISSFGRAEYDKDGAPLRLTGLIQDTTERKKAEEERARMEDQLRQAQKMEALGTLAGGIAHDFNNILGIILGYTEMAHMDADEGSSVRSALKEVLKATNRARELVQQILAFSRRSEQTKEPVQVGPIIKEAVKMLRASLPATIDMKMDITGKAIVLAQPTQILQVLMNLCTNAAHAMQEKGGILEVSLTDVFLEPEAIRHHAGLMPGPFLKLTVKDTGQGIPSDKIGLIFNPFFTTKGSGDGTGLGLAVVQKIVKSHGGAIEVESTLGEGTTFRVFLPAIECVPAIDIVEAAPLPRGRERILVVDDEPALAMAIKKMLEHLGYEVDCRMNGMEALEAFRLQVDEKPFNLVITDMTMPHLTGADLAAKLLELQPNLPIILCTGFSERMDGEKTRSLGIGDFLPKPVCMSELAGKVRRMLDKKPMHESTRS